MKNILVCDYRYKRTEYAAREILEYWIVDPQMQQIMICQWVEGQYEDKVFTGATCMESLVIVDLVLTVEQVFNSANRPELPSE
ncbi:MULTISPECIES: Uma2 family endonuclease [Nostoc]|uniref:Uma2 family endonuclease n=2 Tax=Nostoc TaxID=1177 RepID=A0ABR8IAN2_9NOSO|nr:MULTISPECIES: Uma2 family endonuclease [Nostoc]MBD2562088.1 Uma2 family endonuclease [Nostoc linckia FACHB-391]MBD2647490.1 Uma2 family endonuclease [Nostoc foliaceum FACHB-393]